MYMMYMCSIKYMVVLHVNQIPQSFQECMSVSVSAFV